MTKKNKILIAISITLSLFLIIIFGYEKVMTTYEYPDKMPEDFNFIAKIESNEYCINTYEDTFSKMIDWDNDTIISFKISKEEKKRIYKLIKDYDIIKYPNYFTPPTHKVIRPTFDYYFKCTFDSVSIEINWKFNTESEEKEAKKLRDFLYLIFDKTLKEERIENLPETIRASM